jgi:hypothetical protein
MTDKLTILGIDPGNSMTGYAVIEMPQLKLIEFGKVDNEVFREKLPSIKADHIAIEYIASYGMPVGKDVFDTCVWIGRFIERLFPTVPTYIFRRDEKLELCGNPRAKDANIRQALINRFAKFDFKNGKGTKKQQDVFYGVSKDVWSAIAVAVTYHDIYLLPF